MLSKSFLLSAALLVAAVNASPLAATKTFVERAINAANSNNAADSTNAVVTGAAAVNSVNDNDGIGAGQNVRRSYSGNGSSGQGWPSKSQWVSFGAMFNANVPAMRGSCSQYGVPNNSQDEINAIRSAIESVAASSKVDHRLILATVMQESTGCVRVPTTKAPNYNIYNPGLMQDFDGYYTCNCNQNDEYNQRCGVVTPCPSSTINGMIREGAVGTNDGDGLASLLNLAQSKGTSGEQTFYVAAHFYNQGQYAQTNQLSSYAVDIANRLTGWLGN